MVIAVLLCYFTVCFQHIYSHLESLSAGWSLEIDTFNSPTPKGPINFSNVLAVLDPSAPRRLLLACHYDSKDIPANSKTPDGPLRRFLGASDAAVPCAMILEMVTALDIHLRGLKQQVRRILVRWECEQTLKAAKKVMTVQIL